MRVSKQKLIIFNACRAEHCADRLQGLPKKIVRAWEGKEVRCKD